MGYGHAEAKSRIRASNNDKWRDDWKFLELQRKVPQEGVMSGVDAILFTKARKKAL